jgi:hypothetical protein
MAAAAETDVNSASVEGTAAAAGAFWASQELKAP